MVRGAVQSAGSGAAERITGTGFEAGTLTVYVESAAWSARLRYALAECLPRLRETDEALTR